VEALAHQVFILSGCLAMQQAPLVVILVVDGGWTEV